MPVSQTPAAPTSLLIETPLTPLRTETASPTVLPTLMITLSPTSIPATETPAQSATPLASATPTELPMMVGMPPMLLVAPVFFFIQNTSIMMQAGDQTPERVCDASTLGEIKGAFLDNHIVYLARDQVIQRIELSNGKSEILLDFGLPITRTAFYPWSDRNRVLYAINITGTLGFNHTTTQAGVIDLTSGTAHPFVSGPLVTELASILPLGLSADASQFYGLPTGGDASFTILWVIDTRDGSLKKELPFNGYGAAALSPDKRYVVTTQMWIKDKYGMDTENMVRLYDLTAANISPVDYLIPPKPNAVGYFLWSPDSRSVYFQPHDINTDQPLGVWRLDIPTGSVEQVANFSNPSLYIVNISPDGKWIVLSRYQNDTEGEIRLLDLSNIKAYSFSLSLGAWFAGWR